MLKRLLEQRPRRLLFGALAIVIILLLVALTLQGTLGQSRLDTSRLIPTSQRYLYFANGSGHGILRLDGRPLDEVSYEGAGLPFDASLGWHTLEYNAPPFPPLRCHFTAPPAPGDNCPLLPYTTSVKGPDRFLSGPGRVINLRASLAYLAPAQLAAIADSVNQSLTQFSSTVALAAGDHYRGGSGAIYTATRPLTATLRFKLYVDPRHGITYIPDQTSCRTFCSADLPGSFTANVIFDWLYQDPASGAQIDDLPATFDDAQLLTFRLLWDNSGWLTSFVPYRYQSLDPDCAAASTLLDKITPAFDLNDLIWNSNSLAMAQGCLVGVPLFDAQGNKTNQLAVFFVRCDVAIAINQAARQYAPALPAASANEAQTASGYFLPGT